MIRLKSNQLAYKLFLALCIIGSGVNVHGVDSSTGDVKTVVMQDPANVGEANAMFEEAVRLNQLSRVQNLLRKDRTVKPTQFTVERRFIAAASSGKSEIVQYLLNIEDDRKLTLSNVLEALGKAKNVAVRDILFNDERINPQALEPLVQEFVMANNPSHSMVRGLEKLFAGPNEPPLFKVIKELKKIQSSRTFSKLPINGGGGVFPEISKYDPLYNLSVKKNGVHLVEDPELAGIAWWKLKNFDFVYR